MTLLRWPARRDAFRKAMYLENAAREGLVEVYDCYELIAARVEEAVGEVLVDPEEAERWRAPLPADEGDDQSTECLSLDSLAAQQAQPEPVPVPESEALHARDAPVTAPDETLGGGESGPLPSPEESMAPSDMPTTLAPTSLALRVR